MAKGTKIEWADDTVNAEMGCEGCESWDPKNEVRIWPWCRSKLPGRELAARYRRTAAIARSTRLAMSTRARNAR